MSHKVTTFGVSLPGVKTLDKFLVVFPGWVNPLRVSAAQFPRPSVSTANVAIGGRTLFFPGKQVLSNSWTCTVDEDQLMSTAMSVEWLRDRIKYRQNLPIRHKLIDIYIFLTDQITGAVPVRWVTLKGAWLERITPLQLDWSGPDKPVKWQLTFKFNDIKDYPF